MKMRLFMAALLCLAAGNGLAQQKQQVSFKVPGENSKYIVSQNVDGGDAPNHMLRLFDVHHAVPNNTASINGVKLVEVIARGVADLTDGHGDGNTDNASASSNYLVFVADNGDKLFARNITGTQRVYEKMIATWAGYITGGTGKLANIQGATRLLVNCDPSPGGVVSNSQFDIEYSIGK
jgi:hypothetical protein